MVGGAGSLHRVQISQVTLPLSQQAGLSSVSAGSGVQDLSLCGLDLDGMVKESGRQMMDFTLSHNNGRRMPSPHVSALVVSTFGFDRLGTVIEPTWSFEMPKACYRMGS